MHPLTFAFVVLGFFALGFSKGDEPWQPPDPIRCEIDCTRLGGDWPEYAGKPAYGCIEMHYAENGFIQEI